MTKTTPRRCTHQPKTKLDAVQQHTFSIILNSKQKVKRAASIAHTAIKHISSKRQRLHETGTRQAGGASRQTLSIILNSEGKVKRAPSIARMAMNISSKKSSPRRLFTPATVLVCPACNQNSPAHQKVQIRTQECSHATQINGNSNDNAYNTLASEAKQGCTQSV